MELLKAEFSAKVADALEAGSIPWRLPCLPRNILTNHLFGGVNPILLNLAGHASPFWGSYIHWQTLGCKVGPSEGRWIVLYKPNSRSKMESYRPVREMVYNWEQTDRAYRRATSPPTDPGESLEMIVKNAGVCIEHGADATCKYIIPEDKIRMPHKWMFELGPAGVSGYYDAKSHELCHWSERRVGWRADEDKNELRAEIGACYLGAALGVQPIPQNKVRRHHDRFARRWATLLRQDPDLLFRVCENVTLTVGYFLAFIGREPQWQLNI